MFCEFFGSFIMVISSFQVCYEKIYNMVWGNDLCYNLLRIMSIQNWSEAVMTLYQYGDPEAKTVLIQPVDDHDLSGIENEVAYIRELTDRPFHLVAFKISDWNRDLSPWEAPAVFGDHDFGAGAEETLREVLSLCEDPEKTYYLGGYSLAALFALWAAFRTDRFSGIAAASPSMWFPGFVDFIRANECKSDCIYLSLGNKEEKARNPVMATVGDRMREAFSILKERNLDCILEWNEGNHFRDADIRTAKGFVWVLERK